MAENGERSIRQRFLKRQPLREDLALTLDVERYYTPIKRRAAVIYADVPAGGALITGGLIYFPPPQGARVRWCSMSAEGASQWRFGILLTADLSTSAFSNNAGIRNIHADAPILGRAECWQFFGIGDMVANLEQGHVEYPDLLVFPPNIFVLATTVDNLVAEGAAYIEEFLNGDEDL